eukprot:c9847_g1_i1.p3 GENE.c9847_g1_i1~~c9847_g1_i1.p3  ORF type:complete len:127 (+),score=22.26 c9847_g1_i1:745-1125(+)
MYSRLHLNTLQLCYPVPATDNESEQMIDVTSVFVLGSMLNHSCVPNVGIRPIVASADVNKSANLARTVKGGFSGNLVEFVCSRDVQKGEELTISYIDESAPVNEARDFLKWAYGFDCDCARCRNLK